MTTATIPRAVSPVGRLLQYWRGVRRKSQLALALEAEVSARHLSFVETGRARPSREMVLTLAAALDVPLRERNDFLLAAGYAPLYRESDLDAPELAPARQAIGRVLGQQEPYPAVVLDRYWNLVRSNRGADRLFGLFLDPAALPRPANVLRLMFDPAGLRPFVANWEALAPALLRRVHREAVGGAADEATLELLEEILSYPGVPRSWGLPDPVALSPFVPVHFRRGVLSFCYFSVVTTLGTPQDVTLQELRIESFFPADGATGEGARALARRRRR
jgi:transcriptional regulator with XRE-family HTH domain